MSHWREKEWAALGAVKMREVPLFSCVFYQQCCDTRLVDINTFPIVHSLSAHCQQEAAVSCVKGLYFVVVGPSSNFVAQEQLSLTSSCGPNRQVMSVPFWCAPYVGPF